jgi:hypothetical protein
MSAAPLSMPFGVRARMPAERRARGSPRLRPSGETPPQHHRVAVPLMQHGVSTISRAMRSSQSEGLPATRRSTGPWFVSSMQASISATFVPPASNASNLLPILLRRETVRPGQIIHCDIKGPLEHSAYNKARFALVVDEATRIMAAKPRDAACPVLSTPDAIKKNRGRLAGD